jgi:hypothetical protein
MIGKHLSLFHDVPPSSANGLHFWPSGQSCANGSQKPVGTSFSTKKMTSVSDSAPAELLDSGGAVVVVGLVPVPVS